MIVNSMERETIDRYFRSSIGEQCDNLFSAKDFVFIRREEAEHHCEKHGYELEEIVEWFNEY